MEYIIDIEANGLLDEATVIHCAVLKDIHTEEVTKFFPDEEGGLLDTVALVAFLSQAKKLIAHNGHGYDFPLMKKLLSFDYQGEKWDTLAQSRLQRPERTSHSVDAWGKDLGRGKPEHEDWSTFTFDMLHRCSEDVEIQYQIYCELQEQASQDNWIEASRLTNRLFEILSYQEQHRWKVDVPFMLKGINQLDKWISWIDKVSYNHLPDVMVVEESKVKGEYKYVAKPFKKDGTYCSRIVDWISNVGLSVDSRPIGGPFTRVAFRKLSLNSNAETKDFLLEAGWIPEEWNYSKTTGERTSPKLTKDDPFIGVNGKLGRLIARRVQCRHRMSTLQGWVGQLDEEGSLPSVVTGLATTGRMKHSVIVNVPGIDSFYGKSMRRCFIARDGFVLVGCDSAGCQNRMLAARVGDPVFTDTLINGKKEDETSIHHVNKQALMSSAAINVSYHTAKTLNYAFMFGASDRKLGRIVNGSPTVGAKARKALLSVSAGFSLLVEDLTKEWRKNAKRKLNRFGRLEYYDGWLPGLDGRPIYISSEHKLLVFILQSDEAIMMSAAYCFLYKRLLNKGLKWGEDFAIVCFYHDEYTIEVKEEYAQMVAEIAEQCIVDAGLFYKIDCPHAGEAAIGNNWMEIH